MILRKKIFLGVLIVAVLGVVENPQVSVAYDAISFTADMGQEIALTKESTEIHRGEGVSDHTLFMSFLSSITITGFILAVWALGTLLHFRPPTIKKEQVADSPNDSCYQVVWLVIMVVVLNIYDLICTLFAHGVGGLWELNPIASPMVEAKNIPMIITFKLSMTIGAAILILVGRRLKLAQIGVWWIGVLYTVLIIRWTALNSIFL